MTKSKTKAQPVERTSASVVADQVAALGRVFPEAVAEGKVDFDKLRATLGDAVETRQERFSFGWAGKQDSIAMLQTPSRATLVPCPEESVNFDATQHLFIEGDNLEVLKLLFKPYFGRVKLIYIDPPYNTGQDFIYPDNYADPLATYLKLTGQVDQEGNLLTSNPESSGRYHSSWLSMMYPRLFLARQLLREDGIVFVSIDEHELQHLLMLLNEIFGEENQIGVFTWVKKKKGSHLSKTLRSMTEFVVAYARDREMVELFGEQAYSDKWQYLLNRPNAIGIRSFPPAAIECTLPDGTYEAKMYGEGDLAVNLLDAVEVSQGRIAGAFRMEGRFKWSQQKIAEELALGTRIAIKSLGFGPNMLRHDQADKIKRPTTLLNSEAGIGTNEDATAEIRQLFGIESLLDYPKPTSLLKYLVNSATYWEQDGIVMDFFAGSSSTADAVLQLNREDGGTRRFIMVQLPEPTERPDYATIAEIGKERIRRVIAMLKKDEQGKLDMRTRDIPEDLGFKVFKLAASNYVPWTGTEDRDPEKYIEQLTLFTDPLVAGWTPENVIWEVAVKEGYGLNSRIKQLESPKENTIYHVTDPDKKQSFRICLDEKLTTDIAKTLGLGTEDLFICRDRALDDTLAANLALQCRLKVI